MNSLCGAASRDANVDDQEPHPLRADDKSRYPSDLTDEDGSLIEPLIPPADTRRPQAKVVMRQVVNDVMYVLSTGCQWRSIPRTCRKEYGARLPHPLELRRHDRDDPPRSLCAMPRGDGAGGQSDGLRDRQPEREKRGKGGACVDPPGYDAGKKIRGKKRHILVDTVGLLLHAVVHPADVQDRDGGVLVLTTLFGMYPFLVKLFADAGYQGPQFGTAVAEALPHFTVEIVKRGDKANGFVVLPMRWVVERTLAWLNRCRRLAEELESLSRNARAFLPLCINPPDAAKALQSGMNFPDQL